MIELLLQTPHMDQFLPGLLGRGNEGCVVLLTRSAARTNAASRLLAWDYVIPDATEYDRRGLLEAQLNPDFVARITKRAKKEGCGLVFIHSHPGDAPPQFSSIDDEGEKHLSAFLHRRIPNAKHIALVMSAGGCAARILGTREPIRVIEVGVRHRVLYEGERTIRLDAQSAHDRQIRAFGADGQQRLNRLSVGIIGLGGTGSIVAQQLAHLGIRQFLLIDPDTVDVTNLNRLANASISDIGYPKTEVAKRYIQTIAPDAQVPTIVGDVTRSSVARRLADVDILFGCTDSHGSRAVLQQIAYQYLVPCIDMGSTIIALDGKITHIHGRVQMLAPGMPCLTCSQLLDANEVRRDMMTEFEKKTDPYIVGAREPAPAVMSLNATVASLAVTMLLNAVTEMGGRARHLLYNAISSNLRNIAPKAQHDCFICSIEGVLARGDDAPLMARQG
jgi:molybdopterin/thiamine biosynthesis adenylyltransferase